MSTQLKSILKINISYNINKKLEELQQTICNIVSYTLYLYENKYISERTKEELLKRCQVKEDDNNEKVIRR